MRPDLRSTERTAESRARACGRAGAEGGDAKEARRETRERVRVAVSGQVARPRLPKWINESWSGLVVVRRGPDADVGSVVPGCSERDGKGMASSSCNPGPTSLT